MAYNFRDHQPEVERGEQHEESEDEHFQPIGSTEAGYAPPSDGPFKCGNCIHYKKLNGTHGTCDHPDVIEDAKNGEIPLGKEDGAIAATVAFEGCCNMFKPGEHE